MTLIDIWKNLYYIQSVRFIAKSNASSGWTGEGIGKVMITSSDNYTVISSESGQWISNKGKRFDFHNIYKWTLFQDKHKICLEHLRFGNKYPVHLFNLELSKDLKLTSTIPYLCGNDQYTATMYCQNKNIHLYWQVTGPNKDEKINYIYW